MSEGTRDEFDELLEERRELRAAREEVRRLEGMMKQLELRGSVDAKRLRLITKLSEAPNPKPYRIYAKKRKDKDLPEATYISLASDWHVEERVRPETIGWRNEYNPDIAEERAEQFWKSNLTMLKTARAAWKIEQYLLWLGGDFITGYIHEEYEEENFKSPTQASLFVFDILARGIKTLLAKSDCKHILIVTSHGNHGRTFKKPRIGTAAANSYEWLIYQMLDRHFVEEPRVTFQIANGYHNIADLYGKKVRFHHGDEIRYMGGVGGLAVPAQRRIARQARGDAERIFLDAFGHHHHLQYPPSAIVNGSLIGWNTYAEAKGFDYQEPLQASFVIDSAYKVVSNFNPIIVKV